MVDHQNEENVRTVLCQCHIYDHATNKNFYDDNKMTTQQQVERKVTILITTTDDIVLVSYKTSFFNITFFYIYIITRRGFTCYVCYLSVIQKLCNSTIINLMVCLKEVSSKNYKTQDHFFDISTLHVGYFGGTILTIFIPRHGQTHNLYRGSFRVTI